MTFNKCMYVLLSVYLCLILAQVADPVVPAESSAVVNPPQSTPSPSPPAVTEAKTSEAAVNTPAPATSAQPTTRPAQTSAAPPVTTDKVTPSKTTANAKPTEDAEDKDDDEDDTPASKTTDKNVAATPSSSATATPKKSESSNNNIAIIVGSVVGGIVGLAFVGGVMAWINRRGGCARRTKNRHGFTEEDYTVNMNQQDFNPPPVAPVVPSNQSTEPLSPYDRYNPSYPSEFHDPYRQDNYQNGYYDGYHQPAYTNYEAYPPSADWNQPVYQNNPMPMSALPPTNPLPTVPLSNKPNQM